MAKLRAARISAVLCALMLFAPCAAWASPEIKAVTIGIGADSVSYPQISGLESPGAERAINDDIVNAANILSHIATLGTLREDGWGLKVDHEGGITGSVMSVLICAKGEMPTGRNGQSYTALCYDINTGERLAIGDVFKNPDAARAYMEAELVMTLSDEISGYAPYGDITPIPADNFRLSPDGITFYYPFDRFSYISEYSGACQFYFSEIHDFLDLSDKGALALMGVAPVPDGDIRRLIEESCVSGMLPHVPVAIGDGMAEVIEKYRLLRDPDRYPGGRYFYLEAPEFRRVALLSDAMTSGWALSEVQGIFTKRADLYGIRSGVTTRERWREILGPPQSTVDFPESLAYDYGLIAGQSDYYDMGGYQLRLHADAQGVLHSAQLAR